MENSRQIYFKNGYILTMNASNQVYACGSLLVEGDKWERWMSGISAGTRK